MNNYHDVDCAAHSSRGIMLPCDKGCADRTITALRKAGRCHHHPVQCVAHTKLEAWCDWCKVVDHLQESAGVTCTAGHLTGTGTCAACRAQQPPGCVCPRTYGKCLPDCPGLGQKAMYHDEDSMCPGRVKCDGACTRCCYCGKEA